MITAIYDDGAEDVLTPSDAARNVFDAITNEMQNDRLGTFTHEDGTSVAFEITVRIKNPVPSPESEDSYPPCPKCGNESAFRGTDEACGAMQRFDLDEAGEPDYCLFEPFDIGAYTEIHCVECDTLIWSEYLT